jgi:hypothetical protein
MRYHVIRSNAVLQGPPLRSSACGLALHRPKVNYCTNSRLTTVDIFHEVRHATSRSIHNDAHSAGRLLRSARPVICANSSRSGAASPSMTTARTFGESCPAPNADVATVIFIGAICRPRRTPGFPFRSHRWPFPAARALRLPGHFRHLLCPDQPNIHDAVHVRCRPVNAWPAAILQTIRVIIG